MSVPTEPTTQPMTEPTTALRRPPLPTWSFIAMIVVVQVADRMLDGWMEYDRVPGDLPVRQLLRSGQWIGDVAFLAVAVVVLVFALLSTRPRWTNVLLVAYLSVATVNLALNVGALVATADHLEVAHLALLWDVALVYLSTVFVFALWYRLLDSEITGGAFELPPDPARPDRQPGWVDYVFLSFNTNATFGPTAEVVHSRTAKVVMMTQTVISLLVLVVLLGRIVGLGG